MDVAAFTEQGRQTLLELLSDYLTQRITHEQAQRVVDEIFGLWEAVETKEQSYAPGENELWCALWATQHLATQDHWEDGSAQIELSLLRDVLRGKIPLPPGYRGQRP